MPSFGDIRALFWKRVAPPNERGCMLWTGCKMGAYGCLRVGGKRVYAHRAAWLLARGPIADGLVIRHVVCGTPLCCNPDHLQPGTHAENVADTVRMGRLNPPRGERSPFSSFTEADVVSMRAEADAGVPVRVIAERRGLNPSGVGLAVCGITWSHLPPAAARRRRSKLSDDDVQFARDWVGAGWTHASVARALGVTASNITMIVGGKRRVHV